MARPIRIEYPGAVYHVITRGNNRQVIFKDDRDRRTYLEKLSYYCEQKEVELLCYSLLSNHVHLLLETPKGNLSKFMQPFQTSYTVHFNKRHGRTGHVFEQRYKAFLVDKDHYLLQVSRYIHLNCVGAKIVARPQNYRWSSYRAYVGEDKGISGLNRDPIFEQFGGTRKRSILDYRNFVEGEMDRGGRWTELPVIKQAFIGDEDFVRQARKKIKRDQTVEGGYRLSEIVPVICKVVGVEREQLRRSTRQGAVQVGREMLIYLARRYGEASLREMVKFLGVKEMSTVSHGLGRAERKLKSDQTFRQQMDEALKKLTHSPMQA